MTKTYEVNASFESILLEMQKPLGVRTNAEVIRRSIVLAKNVLPFTSYTSDGKNILKVLKPDGSTVDIVLNS